ncbi:MAG: hypothetical protein PHD54_03445 [Desulfuromonadaceae bacterium]|nr:hypothetical protein [Desulfuromonadaceae bacterium]
MSRQSCAVCAWREHCNKRFCIPDSGARCPDFSRDVSIRDIAEDGDNKAVQKEQMK